MRSKIVEGYLTIFYPTEEGHSCPAFPDPNLAIEGDPGRINEQFSLGNNKLSSTSKEYHLGAPLTINDQKCNKRIMLFSTIPKTLHSTQKHQEAKQHWQEEAHHK
jgi:hypothetical protein